MRAHIEKGWNGVQDDVKKVYLDRIMRATAEDLDDLTFLAKKLPEDKLNRIFNVETLVPFLKALLPSDQKNKTRRQYEVAAALMKIGIDTCLKKVPKVYLNERMRQAVELRRLLTYECLGSEDAIRDV
jgi:hypothetical protein